MFSVIPEVFADGHSPQEKAKFLYVAYSNGEYFGQEPAAAKVVAAKVDALLRSRATSNDGLVLLDSSVHVLPHGVVRDHIIAWIRMVTRLLSLKRSDGGQHVAWTVLAKLYQRLASFPEHTKDVTEVVSGIVQKILEWLSSEMSELHEGTLKCLEECMKHFSVLLGPYQGALEKLLCKHLLGWNPPPVQELLCRCLALLPWCSRGSAHKQAETWIALLRCLMATNGLCLDALFQDLNVAKSNIPPDAGLPLENPAGSSPYSAAFLSWRRVQSTSHAISVMLRADVPCTVAVPAEGILGIVRRILRINPCLLYSQPTAHEKVIASIVPSLQCSALDLLRDAIHCCRQALTGDSESIVEMVVQVILRSTASSCLDIRKLRKAAYATLGLWLQVSKSAPSLEGNIDKLISIILKDAQIVTGSIRLSRQGSNVPSASSVTEDSSHVDISEDTCEQALHVLQRIISTLGPRLNSDLLRKVQHSLVVLLLKVQQQRCSPPLPYGSYRCRIALYSALLSVMVNFNSSASPPLTCCLKIFSAGLQDRSFEVAELCTHALACGSLISHPVAPSLSRHALSGHEIRCTRTTRDASSQAMAELPDTACAATQTCPPTGASQEAKHHRPHHGEVQPCSNYRGEVCSEDEECDDDYDEDEPYSEELEEEERHAVLGTHNGRVAGQHRYYVERTQVKRPMDPSPLRGGNRTKRLHVEDVDDEESAEDESLGSMDEEEDEEEGAEYDSGGDEVSTADMPLQLIDLDNECNDEPETEPEANRETVVLSGDTCNAEENDPPVVEEGQCVIEEEPSVVEDEPSVIELNASVAGEEPTVSSKADPPAIPEQTLVISAVEGSLQPTSNEEAEIVTLSSENEVCVETDAAKVVKSSAEDMENHVDAASKEESVKEVEGGVLEAGESVEAKTEGVEPEEVAPREHQDSCAAIKEEDCPPPVAVMLLDFVDSSPDD